MKNPLKTRLPSAPVEPHDRIARAADRWTQAIHHGQPLFAATIGVLAAEWQDPERRRAADFAVHKAYGDNLINGEELDTWVSILRLWADMTPGACMAAIVAFTELHGQRYPDPYRVLTMRLAE